MEDRRKYFFDNINIKEEDVERANNFIFSKGIEYHIDILEKIKPWYTTKIDYELIASIYRYDKRLRNVLFKYISYLEERYRSIVLDYYRFKKHDINSNLKIMKKINSEDDLKDGLELLLFSELINLILGLEECKALAFPNNDNHLAKNLQAITELRNTVMHNKMLILYRGLKECYTSNDNMSKSSTLKDNIINLINLLPNEVKEKCKQDINDCSLERNNKDKTVWILPDFIIVYIS